LAAYACGQYRAPIAAAPTESGESLCLGNVIPATLSTPAHQACRQSPAIIRQFYQTATGVGFIELTNSMVSGTFR
jgi:hypothetical protein